jgi:hypothetical protein
MQWRRFISLLFISLVVFNLLHDIVPHHHHIEDAVAHNCCETQDQHHEHEQDCDGMDAFSGEPCTHCHAFNGMEYYPITQKKKTAPLKIRQADVFSSPYSLPDLDVATPGDILTLADLPDPYRSLCRRARSLRAPPSAC